MKIEKLDKDNIKEYIRDMKITCASNMEDEVGKLNEFGIKKDDKFIFSFFLSDNCICASFGNSKVDDSLVKEIFSFLNSNLSFDGHLLVLIEQNRVMDIMDSLYRIKDVSVSKKIRDVSFNSQMREKYAEIDMRSIKYFASKEYVSCNLYSQNIQDEEVIRKLDEYFSILDVGCINFTILPDSLSYIETLGYKCDLSLIHI